jgi:hypothetical protein
VSNTDCCGKFRASERMIAAGIGAGVVASAASWAALNSTSAGAGAPFTLAAGSITHRLPAGSNVTPCGAPNVLLEIVRCGAAALMPPASWLGMNSSTFVPLAIHRPFGVEPVEPVPVVPVPVVPVPVVPVPVVPVPVEPVPVVPVPVVPVPVVPVPVVPVPVVPVPVVPVPVVPVPVVPIEPVDVEAIGAVAVLLVLPQAASRPLMTTATEMILSSSSRLGLMTENGFMASPLRFVCERCVRVATGPARTCTHEWPDSVGWFG